MFKMNYNTGNIVSAFLVVIFAIFTLGHSVYILVRRETERYQRVSQRKEVCMPYVVLAHYTMQGQEYVVCGNKEHRLIEYEK